MFCRCIECAAKLIDTGNIINNLSPCAFKWICCGHQFQCGLTPASIDLSANFGFLFRMSSSLTWVVLFFFWVWICDDRRSSILWQLLFTPQPIWCWNCISKNSRARLKSIAYQNCLEVMPNSTLLSSHLMTQFYRRACTATLTRFQPLWPNPFATVCTKFAQQKRRTV